MTPPSTDAAATAPGNNTLRSSRGARPQEVYNAAVQQLERTLAPGSGMAQGDPAKGSQPGPPRRSSIEGYRPGALSAISPVPSRPASRDGDGSALARASSHAGASSSSGSGGGQRPRSSLAAQQQQQQQGRRSPQRRMQRAQSEPHQGARAGAAGVGAGGEALEVVATAIASAVLVNRGLSIQVTEEQPLGQRQDAPPVSPVAAHAPAAMSRNLNVPASSRGVPGGASSRPPSSRLRYESGSAVGAAIRKPDGGRIKVPSRGAAAALRISGGEDMTPSAGAAAGGNDLVAYLERLNSTLQKGGGAEAILATSMDAGGPPALRRRPTIQLSASRPSSAGSAVHREDDAGVAAAATGRPPEGAAPSLVQRLLTPRGAEQTLSNTSSPKGPYSKAAQMLVDAIRSKDNQRLHEVIAHLRGLKDDGPVRGIDDRHAVTGRTPLHEAVMLNRLTSVQILLQAGADPNLGHATQGPPLLHAAAWGETALVEALVLCGSDIDAVDCAEYTALHYAAVGEHCETVRTLVAHGARLDAANDEGNTPLDLAASEQMQVTLMQAVASSPPRPKNSARRATAQEVEAALERLRTATPDSAAASPPSTLSRGSSRPDLNSAPGSPFAAGGPLDVRQPFHRPATQTTNSRGAQLADIISALDTPAGVPAAEGDTALPGGAARRPSDDGNTPPLLQDVSPTSSPPNRSIMPPPALDSSLLATAAIKASATLPEERMHRVGTPRLNFRRVESDISSRPGTGGRPSTGMWDASGRTLGNSHATATAAKAAAAVGTPVSGLNTRAAQMFYTSVEVQTGDITWTRGELIGEGAYGKVYAGLNQLTGELMAVKVLPLSTGNSGTEERHQLESLEHELGMYRKFKHRHIVGYIAAHMDFKTNTMYIFLEYVPGGSIASMLDRFGAFSEELCRKYTRELLMGLEYLHGCKVIHRDLKGGNVLVTRNGRVKLADFGASKAYHEATITDGMKSIRGSVFWMAPEVIKGTGYGRRADIWSVGCTVLEMLTGTHPWPNLDNHWSAMFHIAKAKHGPPLPDNVTPICRDFLQCCFQVDARLRPTATELLQHPYVSQIPDALREAEMARGLNHSL